MLNKNWKVLETSFPKSSLHVHLELGDIRNWPYPTILISTLQKLET